MNELLTAALRYASVEIPVFPLHNLTPSGIRPCSCGNAKCERKTVAKHPRTEHGFKDATLDEKKIREWWKQWPAANIGIPTGEASGLVVLDIDSLETKDKLKELVSFNGEPKVRTAHGFHVYYRYDGRDFRNKVGIIPGLDFRGNGGYVVVPPSVHATKKSYAWVEPISDHNLRPVPPDLEKLLTTTQSQGQSSEGYRKRFDSAQALHGVPEGQRDETLFKLAAKLRNADVPREMAETLLVEAARNCNPPFSEKIARDKVARVYQRYEPKPEKLKGNEFRLELISMKDLLALPPDPTRWIWDQTLPAAGASVLVSKPKIGKSTFAANLAVAIARGLPFLCRATQQSPVAYLSLDASLPEMVETFAPFRPRDTDPIFIHAGAAPKEAIAEIMQWVRQHEARFVIVDTMQRLFRFQNVNDYSEVTNAIEPLTDAAREQ